LSSPSPSARGTPSWVANLVLLAVSLLLVAITIEAGVRWLVDFDRYKPFGVHDVDHAGGGLSFLPGSHRRYEAPEFTFEASYNAFGRRDVEWPPEVVADPSSVLFIGDSFAYGIGVEAAETLPSRLETRFARAGRPVEVMNFGMPGNGAPPTYAAMLDDAIAKGFAARTVVALIFVGNDFYPNVLEPAAAPPPPTRPAGPAANGFSPPRWKTLDFVRVRVSQSARLVGWTLTLSRLLGITVYDSGGSYVFLRQRTPDQEALFRRILSFVGDMKERCDETGRRFFAVVLPNRIQVENRQALSGGVYDAARPNRDVMAYCEEIGIRCLDLLPMLSETYERDGAPLFYPVDRHLNPYGYRLVGEAIGTFLLEAGVP
jgi:hypothetical protein